MAEVVYAANLMTQPDRRERGWDPLAELQALRVELGRLVGSALVGAGGGTPDIELTEIGDGWTVVARLPGVAPEEVALELDDRELCIRARSEEEVNADQGMPGAGSRRRSFEYQVALPGEVDADRIDAVMDHGLLTVHLPRAAARRRRSITVGSRMYDRMPSTAREPRPIDPAADRELHRPDIGDTALRQPG